jgi:signal transduction histidine kinase
MGRWLFMLSPLQLLRNHCRRMYNRFQHFLPQGGVLPDHVWEHRHRVIVGLLWIHIVAFTGFGLLTSQDMAHSVFEVLLVAVPALLATWKRRNRRFRATCASFGLVSSSAVLVHLSGGYVEMHFHFFIAVALITLYQDWQPYFVATGYVILHHGVLGVLMPASVYNHPDAWAHPWRWALIHGVFILLASVVGIVNWRFNESERMRAEQALRERIAAEEAIRLRDQFLSVAAHELKNPLTSMLGYAEFIQRRQNRSSTLEDRDQHALGTIVSQGARLNKMVGELLDVSRIESGQLEIVQEAVDLRQLIVRMVESIRLTMSCHHIEFISGDESVLVHGDEARLEQVVQNLLQNAIKYSPQGGVVKIIVSQRGSEAIVEVADNGIGIPREALPLLFNRFFRARNAEHGYTSCGRLLSDIMAQLRLIASRVRERRFG